MYVSDRTSRRYTCIYLTQQVSPDALWSLRRREIESGLAHKRQTCMCYSLYLNDFWRFTIDSKVIANWPLSCEGLQKLLLSSFSFHLQFYWLTEALISERKFKGLAFSWYMMLFSEREKISRGLVDMVLFLFDYVEQRPCFQNVYWPATKVILFQSNC